jgi:hypothetical protein
MLLRSGGKSLHMRDLCSASLVAASLQKLMRRIRVTSLAETQPWKAGVARGLGQATAVVDTGDVTGSTVGRSGRADAGI